MSARQPGDDGKTIQSTISAALLGLTRTTNSLAAADVGFQKSIDGEFERRLLAENSRLRAIADRLVRAVAGSAVEPGRATGKSSSGDDGLSLWTDGPAVRSSLRRRPVGLAEQEESAVEALDRNWKGLVDVLDRLLEKADSSLDEYSGVVKTGADTDGQPSGQVRARPAKLSRSFQALDIPKPQLKFNVRPDNLSNKPFMPLLASKPHAVVPLDQSLQLVQGSYGTMQHDHPYRPEIEQYEYPAFVTSVSEPVMYTPFADSSAIWVDSPAAVEAMMEELKSEKLIAIDLEHHDYRTYSGLLSLMQISTRTKDWIVDTLQPWRSSLQRLNEVFADPSIVKVFHGAMMDIIWLQRDLGLYIVGLFDTGHAARALQYPAASLAYLLSRFASFDAQKQYQVADWRVRPLPTEMFDYARSDTHFLLYIFDCLRNELLTSPPLPSADGPESRMSIVARKSKDTALQTYTHHSYDRDTGQGPAGWYKAITRSPAVLSPSQFEVFRSVHAWRDRLAREEDEGIQYVMPNHVLYAISYASPSDKPALLAAFPHPSPLTRSRLDELVRLISAAFDRGKTGPSVLSMLNKIDLDFKLSTRTSGLTMGDAVRMLKLDGSKPRLNPTAAPFANPALQTGVQTLRNFNPANRMKLRSASSAFWGNILSYPTGFTFSSSPAAGITSGKTQSDISLPVPLPNLTAMVYEPVQSDGGVGDLNSPVPVVTVSASKAKPGPSHQFVPSHKRDDLKQDEVFVVRQLGMKKSGRAAVGAAGSRGVQADRTENTGSESDQRVSDSEDGTSSSHQSGSRIQSRSRSVSVEPTKTSRRSRKPESTKGRSEEVIGDSGLESSSALLPSAITLLSDTPVPDDSKSGSKRGSTRVSKRRSKNGSNRSRTRSRSGSESHLPSSSPFSRPIGKPGDGPASDSSFSMNPNAVPFDYSTAQGVLSDRYRPSTSTDGNGGPTVNVESNGKTKDDGDDGSSKKLFPSKRPTEAPKAATERKRPRQDASRSGTWTR